MNFPQGHAIWIYESQRRAIFRGIDLFSNRLQHMEFSQGHAIWIYEPSDALANAITAYNATADVKITYLFVYDGSLQQSVELLNEGVDFYSERFPDLSIFPNVDGLADDLAGLSDGDVNALIQETCNLYNSDRRISGVHFDIEPYSKDALSFYARIKNNIEKPLSIALSRWDDDVISICDLPVLMGYDIGATPTEYGIAARRVFGDFTKTAVRCNRPFMLGLPFVATREEYEYRISKSTGTREESGFSMSDYLAAGIDVADELKQLSGFVGIAVWGGLSRPITSSSEDFEWHPHEIAAAGWRQLADFSLA